MSELPKGWERIQLSSLGKIVTGKTPPKKESQAFDGEIPFIKPGDIQNKGAVLSSTETISEFGKTFVHTIPADSIVVTCIGNLGRAGLTIKESATNQQINSVIPNGSVNPRYLYYYILTMRDWLEQQSSATTVAIVNKKKFSSMPVVLAPLEEQKRIADKLDSVLAKVEAAQARLDKIPSILKRFRQSVLAAATSGELAKDFRGNNEFGKVVCIGDLTSDIKYGTSKKCDYNNELTPVLRIPNISNGVVEPSDMKYAEFDEKEFEKLRLKTGDILIIRSNGSVDLVGKSALISEEYNGFLYAGYLIRLRLPNYENALPAYINIALQSPQVRKVIELNARSTSGVNNINSKELASLSFPLPAVQEQNEIIARVSKLLGKAEKMERKYLSGKASLDSLTQSILSKAFSGKLS